MKTMCAACSMPLDDKNNIGTTNSEGSFCKYCTNPDQMVKSAEQVFNGGMSFFMHAVPGTPKEVIERIVRRNMNTLPYWKKHRDPCLEGPEATDEEYQEAMKQLGEE